MEEIHCDLEEVRHLIRKQLVQNNFIMLLLFVLFCYLAVKGNPSFFIGMLCVLLWIYVAITLYTLMTGKPIGTKTSKVLQEFHKNHFGGKRWKRKKITETVIISFLSVLIIVLFFVVDFNYERAFSIINAIPFIGAWVGYNIGEIIRMNNLLR